MVVTVKMECPPLSCTKVSLRPFHTSQGDITWRLVGNGQPCRATGLSPS